jgi:SAM-dependent methyltransferase
VQYAAGVARGPHRLFFDLWSLVYDAPGVQRVTYRPVQDAVVRALRADPPARVLDVGCGTGRLGVRLSRELPRTRVTGCDLSRGMLSQALARGRALAWVQGDAERLPFADGCFGAVVSTEAFHWFPDPELALAGFHRVLAARGRLLIAFVNPSFEALSRASRVVSRWLGEPLRWPTADVLRRQVETAGFEVLRQRRIFRLPAPVLFPAVLTEAVRRD